MDAAGWLAHWADAEARYLAERDERYRALGEKIRAELHPPVRVAPAPVVLVPAVEVESDSCPVDAVRAAVGAACGAGWAVRVTFARAFEVSARGKGAVVESFAVRCARHDERLWAAWWSGAFECGQYYRRGAGGVEMLGGTRMAAWTPAAVSVDMMTVPQIKELAAEVGIRIPSKYNKAQIVEHVKTLGLSAAPAPPPRRGVLDALEGLHLTRH